MSKVSLQEIFKNNFLGYITKYKESIQAILNDYDVVIFMARKAICFYESMVINGEITNTDCEVLSSRTLDYNVISKLIGKKIAIVDDIVVKGTSLKRVVNILSANNIFAYVLVVACDSTFPGLISENKNFNMCSSYVTLEKMMFFHLRD